MSLLLCEEGLVTGHPSHISLHMLLVGAATLTPSFPGFYPITLRSLRFYRKTYRSRWNFWEVEPSSEMRQPQHLPADNLRALTGCLQGKPERIWCSVFPWLVELSGCRTQEVHREEEAREVKCPSYIEAGMETEE